LSEASRLRGNKPMTTFSSASGVSGLEEPFHLLLEKSLAVLKEMETNQVYLFAQDEIKAAHQAFTTASQMSVQDGRNINLAFGFNNKAELDWAEQKVGCFLLALNAITGRCRWETKKKASTLELWFRPQGGSGGDYTWLPICEGD